MKSGFNPVRWLMIVLLGLALGFAYIYVNLSLLTIPTEKPAIGIRRVAASRFQLSQQARAKELTQVIDSQLVALRNGDYPKAYRYAASALTARLTLRAFERMVKRGYPVIASSRAAAFGLVFDNGVEATVNVSITDAAGEIHHYQYFLEQEPAGWKIRGVSEVESQDTTI